MEYTLVASNKTIKTNGESVLAAYQYSCIILSSDPEKYSHSHTHTYCSPLTSCSAIAFSLGILGFLSVSPIRPISPSITRVVAFSLSVGLGNSFILGNTGGLGIVWNFFTHLIAYSCLREAQDHHLIHEGSKQSRYLNIPNNQ
jgi:hypothetical protein